jgi:hypothetical protein
MTTSKLMDNNRRAHAAKVLAQSSKKNQSQEDPADFVETTTVNSSVEESDDSTLVSLNKQYQVIREDILKLREDLADGYDLLKDYIESRVNLRTLIRAK